MNFTPIPKIGRFISEDPIGLAGGINQFGYVRNNSLNFRDPSGLLPTARDFADGLDELIDRGKRKADADYDTFGWYGKFFIDSYVGASTDVPKLIYDPLRLGRGIGCAYYGDGLARFHGPWRRWAHGCDSRGSWLRPFEVYEFSCAPEQLKFWDGRWGNPSQTLQRPERFPVGAPFARVIGRIPL